MIIATAHNNNHREPFQIAIAFICGVWIKGAVECSEVFWFQAHTKNLINHMNVHGTFLYHYGSNALKSLFLKYG